MICLITSKKEAKNNQIGHEFETHLLPRSLAATRRGFTFYVADPAAPFTNHTNDPTTDSSLMRFVTIRVIGVFVAIVACAIGCRFSILAADAEPIRTQTDFSTFWKKFKSAVIAGDKAVIAEMTKFPLSMPYGVKAVKKKEDFSRRYNEIFKGEANAAQCFATGEPRKESARRYEIYCPFKETPNDRENAPIRFIFELTKSAWKFAGLDNVNE